MRFPTFGHTHKSYFRNGDSHATLDVRPWPIATREQRVLKRIEEAARSFPREHQPKRDPNS